MILVVEGIGAAGKTSWCNRHANGHVVPEASATGPAPDRDADPVGNAGFWVDQSMRRWSLASELARQTGLAVCDTDPLKLHFHWSLWRIGVLPDIHWRLEAELAREAVRTGDSALRTFIWSRLSIPRLRVGSGRRIPIEPAAISTSTFAWGRPWPNGTKRWSRSYPGASCGRFRNVCPTLGPGSGRTVCLSSIGWSAPFPEQSARKQGA